MAAYCPIGPTSVNQTVVRGVAFQVLCSTALFLASGYDFILIYLLFDFFMRGFVSRNLSLFVLMAGVVNKFFDRRIVPVNAEPKIFAARIGFIMCLSILFSELSGLSFLVFFLSGLLLLAAALECFFSICLGCHLYTFIKRESAPQVETENESINAK